MLLLVVAALLPKNLSKHYFRSDNLKLQFFLLLSIITAASLIDVWCCVPSLHIHTYHISVTLWFAVLGIHLIVIDVIITIVIIIVCKLISLSSSASKIFINCALEPLGG